MYMYISGFYPGTFVYSRFSPKIQFFTVCFSSVAPCGGPIVDTKGKILKI